MDRFFATSVIVFGVLSVAYMAVTTISSFDVVAISGSPESVALHDLYYVSPNWPFIIWSVITPILLIISGLLLRNRTTELKNGSR